MINIRFLFCTVLAIAALSIIGISTQHKKEPKSVSQIEAVLHEQVMAWNRGDLETFMKGYWRSPELSFYSGGTKTNGWNQTLERYINRYKSQGREMGTLTFSDLQVEMLGTSHAFVRGHWQLKMASGYVGGLFTLIFRKFPEGWKIIHDHTGSS